MVFVLVSATVPRVSLGTYLSTLVTWSNSLGLEYMHDGYENTILGHLK